MGDFTFLIDFFVIALGVLTALIATFYLIWPKIENHMLKLRSINERLEMSKDKIQLRFAAYERLLLFVHRISPKDVMLRNHDANLTVTMFKELVLADIEREFQHNFTQQLYVSDLSWKIVKDLKESTISLFRNTSLGLAQEAKLDDYVAIILRHMTELEISPYEEAQNILKKELSAQ